jgi:hypothetical protein
MGVIVLDTCVWINLASTPALRGILDALIPYAAPPPHRIIVPASVRTEFARNREDCKKSWQRSIQGYLKSFAHVVQAIPGTRDDLERARKHALDEFQKADGAIEDGIALVDKIFADSETWDPAEADHRDACDRCLGIRAPAMKRSRTSVGDCLLWRAVLSLQGEHCVWFCTSNTGDFSDPKQEENLHPDLLKEVQGRTHQVRFYSDPSQLIEALRAESIETEKQKAAAKVAVPRYYDYAPVAPSHCPNCKAEGAFNEGAYLRSRYGGLTLQYVCMECGYHHDTGEFFD